ncbi:hypothetical protein MYX65_00650 [Acidobacteria bacterium AH-259-L09]|nr:hypothetical protein [Acidobacteria bacterium AH-259-L09]
MTKTKEIEIAKEHFSRILEEELASRTVALVVASILLFAGTAYGDEIRVMTSGRENSSVQLGGGHFNGRDDH